MALATWLLTLVMLSSSITTVLTSSGQLQRLGCWRDTSDRAIPTLEGQDPILDGHYRSRTDAIRKCQDAATSRGYTVFAIQHGGWCASSSDALQTYQKYGPSTGCQPDGEGGLWANEVYMIITRTEFEELQQEVNQLARDLPRTLEELGLTSVVQHVQELKTNEYLGCYRDGSPHSFPRKVMMSRRMTTESCIAACRNAGYTYAATEVSRSSGWLWRSSHDCHCGREANFNRLGQRVCDSECNSRCRGNRRQICGGRYRMSVYKIDAVPGCDGGPRQAGRHWYVTGTTTNLQYQGNPQDRPFAFSDPALDGSTAIPIQSTLASMTADIHGFPSRYPATTAEAMPNLVPDYTALLASLQAPGLRLTAGTNTVLELDQHFAIKSYPCSLEYNPNINGRSKRAISVNIIVVSEKPRKVIVVFTCY